MIKGYFMRGSPFVEAHLVSETYRIKQSLRFMIDTGAARTTLLDKDALDLQLHKLNLPRVSVPSYGIGGEVPTYQLGPVQIIFQTGKQIEIATLRAIMHDIAGRSPDELRKVRSLPSVLGMDVIGEFELRLNRKRNLVELRRP